MRAATILSIVPILSVCVLAGEGRAQECTWKEPSGPPVFAVKGKYAEFGYKLDRTWFKCAREAGGELSLKILAGEKGELKPMKEKKVTSSNVRETVFQSQICGEKNPPSHFQAVLVGTGPMERLNHTSPVIEMRCLQCKYKSYNTMLGVGMNGRRRPALLSAKVDKDFLKCARKSGGKLSVRFYVGATRDAVKNAEKPIFVYRGLEKRNKMKRKIPARRICRHKKKFFGYEFHGTGEFSRLNSTGRSIAEAKCY